LVSSNSPELYTTKYNVNLKYMYIKETTYEKEDKKIILIK
jgi:hypothetical protein